MLPEEASRSFSIKVGVAPPSENRIRIVRLIRGKIGGLAWTKEAKDFKKIFKQEVMDKKALQAAVFSSGHRENVDVYEVLIEIGMPVTNKTFKINKSTGKPLKSGSQTRFKRTDVANRRKLVEDALSEVLSIDDSLFFRVILEKVHSEDEYVKVSIIESNPAYFGVDDED